MVECVTYHSILKSFPICISTKNVSTGNCEEVQVVKLSALSKSLSATPQSFSLHEIYIYKLAVVFQLKSNPMAVEHKWECHKVFPQQIPERVLCLCICCTQELRSQCLKSARPLRSFRCSRLLINTKFVVLNSYFPILYNSLSSQNYSLRKCIFILRISSHPGLTCLRFYSKE